MVVCPYCGSQNEDKNSFCSECGGPLNQAQPTLAPEAPAAPEPPVQTNAPYTSLTNEQAPVSGASNQFVAPVPTGGLLAWSIITLLLCTIPGIVALVQTLGINKSATVEEQQKKLSTAKTWCIVGTILGVLAIIGRIASQSMQ